MSDRVAPVSSGEGFPFSNREIVVEPDSPNGRSNSANLQAVLNEAKALASATNPIVIRLLPGIYMLETGTAGLSLTSASYVKLCGAGPELTIIRTASGWMADSASGSDAVLLNLSSSSHIVLEGIYFDNRTNQATDLVTNKNAPAILFDLADDIIVNRCRVAGVVYGGFTNTASGGKMIESFDSRWEGANGGWRSNAETWHVFSGSMESLVTDATDSAAVVTPLQGVQIGGPAQIWGAHIHCEDQRTTSEGAVAVEMNSNLAGGVEILGSTLHVKVTNDTDTNGRRFAPLEMNSSSAAAALRVSGCNLLIEAPNVTATSAFVGQLILSASHNSQRIEISGNSLRESLSASGLYRRGHVVNRISANTAPTIRWLSNGMGSTLFGWTKAAAVNSAVATLETTSLGHQAGTATLSSGTKAVLLITDAGNAAGTVTFAASTSVSAGTNLDTIFKPGDFVKNAADGDNAWTRIRAVTATTLTLEENYRGSTTGAGQTARLGTQNANTQPDGSYRVSVTPTSTPSAAESYVITSKHASGFTITSTSGTSAVSLDWLLLR